MMNKPVNAVDQIPDNNGGRDQNMNFGWGDALQAAFCEYCDWQFLAPPGSLPDFCPNCFHTRMIELGQRGWRMPDTHPPELVLPFEIGDQIINKSIEDFADGIPYAPKDLSPENLGRRLTRLYLPMWLVDARVTATWQVEAGFDYQVVSHQDRYDGNQGGWISKQVKERRIRWESRLGRLTRRYDNIAAPALEEHAELVYMMGKYQISSANAYHPQVLRGVLARLPNREPQDAWGDAELAFKDAAAVECRRACNADHIRDFNWDPVYSDKNWTLLLQPLYSTYYLDDEGKPQKVLIQGQSGQIYGIRRASFKRAQRAAIVILLVAIAIFTLSAFLSLASVWLPALLVLGVFGLAFSLLAGLGTLWPVVRVWWFNRHERSREKLL
jgi:hypothetical protein